MKNMKRLIVPLSGAIAALFLFVQAFVSCAKVRPEAAEASPLPVRMAAAAARETAEEVKGFGSLSFLKKFELLSASEGILEKLNFREGDRVNKGDIVGIIKNPRINLAARRAEDAYTQARSAMDLASARLRDGEFNTEMRLLENEKSGEELVQAGIVLEEERRKIQNREILYEAGGLSDEAIREERFKFASAEARLALMEKDLEIRRVGLREEDLRGAGLPVPRGKEELKKALIGMAVSALRAEYAASLANLEAASREMESSRLLEKELVITSPGRGIIGARYVEEGERIRRDDRLLTILEAGSLYAVFPVPEPDALKLRKGMAARVFSGRDDAWEGIVDLVSPQADNQSFTFLVRVLLTAGDESVLKPGMFARVAIPLEKSRKFTVIPEAALAVKKENAGKVFIVRNNVLSERNVVLGSIIGDEREIISGLAPGEVVAIGPGHMMKEGVYVSPSE